MATTPEKVLRWLRGRLEDVPSASRFKLMVTSAHNPKGETVLTLDVPGAFKAKDLADEFAVAVMDTAQDVAESMTGVARFTVQSYTKKKDTDSKVVKHLFRVGMKFVLKGTAAEELGIITESETPDKKGQVAQLMRHLENKETMMNNMMVAMTEGVREENESLRRRLKEKDENEMLHKKREDELRIQAMNLEIVKADAQSSRDRKDLMVKKAAEEFFPALAQNVPGLLQSLGLAPQLTAGSAPKPPTAGDLARAKVKDVFFQLPEADRLWLFKTIPDEPGIGFMEVMMGTGPLTPEEITVKVRLAFFALSEEDRFRAISKLPSDQLREELLAMLGR